MAANQTLPAIAQRKRYVSERIVSDVTGRKVRTLQKDRLLGHGPFPHYRLGRKQVVYDLDECIAIIEASRTAPEVA
jgi:hypothetical protein